MIIEGVKLTIYIPYANSLKEKRKLKRSIFDNIRNRFNVSIAEVDTQNTHRILTIGLSIVSSSTVHNEKVLNKVIEYIEKNNDIEITEILYY